MELQSGFGLDRNGLSLALPFKPVLAEFFGQGFELCRRTGGTLVVFLKKAHLLEPSILRHTQSCEYGTQMIGDCAFLIRANGSSGPIEEFEVIIQVKR